VASLAAVIDQLWGRPWPTDPEIHPLDFVSGTPLTHLFKVQNKSFFDMDNIEFTCGVNLMAFKDADGRIVGMTDGAFANGTFSIPRGKSINYACDASGLMRVNPDGSLTSGQSYSTPSGPFRGPLTVVKMCLYIFGRYHLFWTDWAFHSIMFKWPSSQNDPHWVEGPIAQVSSLGQRPPSSSNPDALECTNPT
jgi:hypothetical protein